MQTVNNHTLSDEPHDEQHEAKRYNPGTDILVRPSNRKFRMKIAAGNNDNVEVFREGDIFYVLSTNTRLGYYGLESFLLTEDEYRGFVESEGTGDGFMPLTDKQKLYRKIGVPVTACSSIFCQGDETELIPDWEDISSMSLVKCLLEYID